VIVVLSSILDHALRLLDPLHNTEMRTSPSILLLSGIKNVWHPSKLKFLQSQSFTQNAQARRFRNPDVSGEQIAGHKRAFF
jgi:hypothetical protein